MGLHYAGGGTSLTALNNAIAAQIAASGASVLDWWTASAWPTRPSGTGSYHWVGPASAGQPPGAISGDLVDLVQGV